MSRTSRVKKSLALLIVKDPPKGMFVVIILNSFIEKLIKESKYLTQMEDRDWYDIVSFLFVKFCNTTLIYMIMPFLQNQSRHHAKSVQK